MYDIKMLKAKKIAELIEIAEQIGLKDLKGQKKQELIDNIVGNTENKKTTDTAAARIWIHFFGFAWEN